MQPTQTNQLSIVARLLLAILRIHGSQPDESPAILLQLSCLSRILGSGCNRQSMLLCLRDIVDATVLSPRLSLHLNTDADPNLSRDERQMLGYFDVLLQGSMDRDRTPTGTGSAGTDRERNDRLVRALCFLRDQAFGGIADDHLFRAGAPQRRGLPRNSQPQCFEQSLIVEQLTPGEAFALYSIRLWLMAADQGEDNRRVLLQMHAHLGTQKIAAFIDSVLDAVRRFGQHALGCACFCNATLTADEARLLALLASYQEQRIEDAEQICRCWLGSRIARRLTLRAPFLLQGLQALPIPLPVRSWNFSQLSTIATAERRSRHMNVETAVVYH